MENKEQKRRDFFKLKEDFKKVEKYVDIVESGNRFIKLDFWMDDVLHLARQYYEGKLAQRVNFYKLCHQSDRVMNTCFSLRCVFEREGWDPGILKKYGNYCRYEKEA